MYFLWPRPNKHGGNAIMNRTKRVHQPAVALTTRYAGVRKGEGQMAGLASRERLSASRSVIELTYNVAHM